MKVSDVLSHMNIVFNLKGDIDYNESIDLKNLNLELYDRDLENADFHKAAIEYMKKIKKHEAMRDLGSILDMKIDALWNFALSGKNDDVILLQNKIDRILSENV